MNWFSHFKADFSELAVGFIAGNILWFTRQWLWQQWVKRSHRYITSQNRIEEEKTREEVRMLREQIGHLAVGIMENVEVDPTAKKEIIAALNGEELQ